MMVLYFYFKFILLFLQNSNAWDTSLAIYELLVSPIEGSLLLNCKAEDHTML